MDTKAIADKAEEVAGPVVLSLGYNIVDCEYVNDHGRWVLRFYIEKPDGTASLQDCEKVSRSIEGVLDVENVIPARYVLEVSSPGLDRPLKKEEDFRKFAGRKIRLKTKEPIDGCGNYYGELLGIEGSDIFVSIY